MLSLSAGCVLLGGVAGLLLWASVLARRLLLPTVLLRVLLPWMGESSGSELRNCSARRRMFGPGDRDGEVKPERGDDRGDRPADEYVM